MMVYAGDLTASTYFRGDQSSSTSSRTRIRERQEKSASEVTSILCLMHRVKGNKERLTKVLSPVGPPICSDQGRTHIQDAPTRSRILMLQCREVCQPRHSHLSQYCPSNHIPLMTKTPTHQNLLLVIFEESPLIHLVDRLCRWRSNV